MATRLLAFLEQLDPTLHSLGKCLLAYNSPAASLSTLLQQLREILKTLCQIQDGEIYATINQKMVCINASFSLLTCLSFYQLSVHDLFPPFPCLLL
ncbi:hypothetical protein IMY05_007G0060300 [Salix suchowensis]|nr:hypothetical protein IMY05_007G0060300 [Salix suchowensis]